jgi:hypothetical protein
MKIFLLSKVVLGMALLLPLITQAQSSRPTFVPDSRYPVRPGYDDQRNAFILQEVQCLQATTQALYMPYVAYCKRLKIASDSPDGQLLRAMVDLNQDVSRLATQIRSHCSNPNLPLGNAYRAFHLSEYSSRDSQLMAVNAGYIRSMYSYFRDIDQHLQELGRLGYRNPMLRPLEMDGRSYSSRGAGVPERPFSLPPVPSVQPQPNAPIYPRPDYDRDRDRDEKIDLGDVLKQLFRGKLN